MLNSIGAIIPVYGPPTHTSQVVILNWGWDYGTSVKLMGVCRRGAHSAGPVVPRCLSLLTYVSRPFI